MSGRNPINDVFDIFAKISTLGAGPAADVEEKSDSFVVKCDLPGVNKSDIKIDMKTNDEGFNLQISGNRPCASERYSDFKSNNPFSFPKERWCGEFSRSIWLPPYLDSNKTTATFNNGELTLEIPKNKQYQGKSHAIKIE